MGRDGEGEDGVEWRGESESRRSEGERGERGKRVEGSAKGNGMSGKDGTETRGKGEI